jgi:probable rRNA maturation factor
MMPGPGRKPSRRSAPEGEPAVFAADEQDAVAVDVPRLTLLADHVLRAEGVRGAAELSISFVDVDTIAELNQRYLGGDGPTDVLAFPIDDDVVEPGRLPDGGTPGPDRPPTDVSEIPVLLGDVAVCPEVAARNAAERDRLV